MLIMEVALFSKFTKKVKCKNCNELFKKEAPNHRWCITCRPIRDKVIQERFKKNNPGYFKQYNRLNAKKRVKKVKPKVKKEPEIYINYGEYEQSELSS